MLDLQVDYYSIPSEQIINLSSGPISNNMEYFSMLEKWDKKLSKSSIEAGNIHRMAEPTIFRGKQKICTGKSK